MNLEKVFVCDCETDGFIGDVTKMHVFGIGWKNSKGTWSIKTTPDYENVAKVLTNPENTVVFHNGYSYDVPVLEKLLGIEVKAYIIDTLYLSWVFFPNRIKEGKKYGLESFGEDYGVAKPEIKSWTDLSYEEYENRVSEDVKINILLWEDILSYAIELYGDINTLKSFFKFVNFKAENIKDQERLGVKLDTEKCQENFNILSEKKDTIINKLKGIMPQVSIIKEIKNPGAKAFKKDDTLSVVGKKWFDKLEEYNLPVTYDKPIIRYVAGHEDPNPNSVDQVKDFLFSKGWVPLIYKESLSKVTGESKNVPQLRDKDKKLCKSILELAEKDPDIKYLEELSVINHRIGILKGFLRDVDSRGYLKARNGGLANSCRLQHRELVNLPKPSAAYGEYIRSLLICEEDELLLGSDLSSLENFTRTHFIAPIQPSAVDILKDPEYDSHTQLAIFAKMMTPDEELLYKWCKFKDGDERKVVENLPTVYQQWTAEDIDKEFHRLNIVRNKAKTTSYSALYGIGKTKLAKELKISEKEAQQLLDGYWLLNEPVKVFTEMCVTKEVRKQLWVQNPLNNFWYTLRSSHTVFSVVNQSAGDYCFTLYLWNAKKLGLPVIANFHDEFLGRVKKGEEDLYIERIKKAITMTNKQVKMNVTLGMDYALGKNYAEVH